jgi:2'-5' RNA ligase
MRNVNSSVRAFLSINVDDDSLISHIQSIQQKLDQTAVKMKVVESENIHFTLRFFGDTPLQRLDQIRSCLDRVKINPFEIEIAGVGSFPNKQRPRIVWIGVSENASRILDLKKEIDSSLLKIGYQPERKRYTPHATIARIRFVKNPKLVVSNLESLADEVIGRMIITSVKMTKSSLTSSGPIYETLWEFGQ